MKCSVGTVRLWCLPQALPGDAFWIWQNSTEIQEKKSESEGMLTYPNASLKVFFFFFPTISPSWISRLLFFLQTFASWKMYGFTTINLHLCSLQDRHSSIQTLYCPISCILFMYLSLIYNYLLFFMHFSKLEADSRENIKGRQGRVTVGSH